MLAAPETRTEEREATAPERGEGAGIDEALKPTTTNGSFGDEEVAKQPAAEQQPAASLAAPAPVQSVINIEMTALAEEATPSAQQAAGSGEQQQEQEIRAATSEHAAAVAAPAPPPPLSSSNHRVKPHLAGNAQAIAQVITAGGSSEAKVAQRVVNRSGQKALQNFFSQVFETVTAS